MSSVAHMRLLRVLHITKPEYVACFYPAFRPAVSREMVYRRAGEKSSTVVQMCLSCGCGQPNDKHGNPNNITMDDLQKAAQAANENIQDAAKNIADSVGLSCR